MKTTFRWFGSNDDSVKLEHIKQIPGVEGIVATLSDLPAGEVWPLDRILSLKEEIAAHGFHMDVIESVNIHEAIKQGHPSRDQYIANYITTIRNLAEAGVKVICYNFMPVFDWIRSDLAMPLADGSTVLAYEKALAEDQEKLLARFMQEAQRFSLPGWEPERMSTIQEQIAAYRHISEDDLFDHLAYFLKHIIPVAEEVGIKMALHPDDPPWSIFGLPRIVTNKSNLIRIIELIDSPSHTLTLCSGSLGANPENDIPEIFRHFSAIDRLSFVHIRNIKIKDNGDFYETAHRINEGSLDLYEIVKALHDTGFAGYMRPDHGRMIWDEQARPGYGLYDRALGIMYLLGIWDSLDKAASR